MTVERVTLRLYRALVRAFPQEFRQACGADLAEAAADVVKDAVRQGGHLKLLLLVPRLFADLAARLAVEHGQDLARDARYAARLLTRAPGFTLASVTCLAIGIGLAAAMYAQVQSTVLAQLPGGVRDPQTLVRLHRPVPLTTFEAFRDAAPQFSSVAAYLGPVPLTVAGRDGDAVRVWGNLATPEYFDVLGVRAAAGRLFDAGERVQGAPPVAVLGDHLWRTRFGAQHSIVGRAIRINGVSVTVIGIAPSGFRGASPMTAAADLWLPTTAGAHAAPELGLLRDRHVTVDVIGRLAPGIAAAQAEPALEAVARRLEQDHGDPVRQDDEARVRLLPGGRLFPVRDEDLPRAIGFPLILVSLVLLMACGNVANMVLARSAARRREFAVRLSLGAGRSRILRQLLTESLLLVALGAAGGAVFARWLLSAFEAMRPILPGYVHYDVQFDWRAFAFAALVAAVSTILFSVAPALRASREDIQTALKPAAASGLAATRAFGLRNLLVFQQVTASVVLVLLTGFIVVGWNRAAGVEVGFDPVNLYFLSIDPVRDGYGPDRARQIVERLQDRLRTVRGIEATGIAQTVPLSMSGGEMILSARADLATGTTALGSMRAERVGAGFFETVGTPLLRGRSFTVHDHTDASRAVVVNGTMAARTWPGEDPVGRPLQLDDETWQVVGVVGDIRSAFPLAPTLPAVYQPVTPAGFASPSKHGVTVAVRMAPGVDAATTLTREVEALDPSLTVLAVKRMTVEVEQALFLARAATLVYGGMGVLGLVLAAVGLAAVTAYTVARRTREIGIRIALGARRADVLRLVLREGAAIASAGTAAGMVLALVLTRALAATVDALAETTRTSLSDPALLVGGPALLVAVALAACYLPARRSMRIDPAVSLRAE